MSKKLLPFNITLLNLTDDLVRGITPITTLDTFNKATKNFHDDGLFSTVIFGKVGDEARDRRFSFIPLNTVVIHPIIYKVITKMKAFYEDIMSGKQFAEWDKITRQFIKSTPVDGRTGYSFFMEHFNDLDFEETGSDLRQLYTDLYLKYKKISLVNKIIVIPAGMREFEVDEDGRSSEDEVNNIYRKILSKSNLLDKNTLKNSPDLLDGVVYAIQQSFNELFDYYQTLLEGKKKLILGKWAGRKIFNGTRNVITVAVVGIEDLDSKKNIEMDMTQVGLYQFMKATMPITIHKIKNEFLNKIFIGNNDTAYLVNVKTLKKESITVNVDELDMWVTNAGLEKTITGFAEREIRDRPVMVADHYLGLLYRDKESYCFIQDIGEALDEWDKSKIQPITYAELFYLSVYDGSDKYPSFVTRYPITGFGSIYPSYSYVKTTVESEMLDELDLSGQKTGRTAINMPIKGFDYFDTISPSEFHLVLLGADFDGDTCSLNITYSPESRDEVSEYLNSARFYLNSRGKIVFTAKSDNISLVLKSFTSRAG